MVTPITRTAPVNPASAERDARPPPARPGLITRVLRSPLGALAANRFVDRPMLWAVTRLWFPLSRMWAAAEPAGENIESFADGAGLYPPRGLMRRYLCRVLAAQARDRAQFLTAQAAWDDAAFGAGRETLSEDEFSRIDRHYRRTLLRRLAARLRFLPLWALRRVPPVRLDVPSPASAVEHIDALLERLEAARTEDRLGAVELGRALPAPGGGRSYWVRFPAALGDGGALAWARVTEPESGTAKASVIFVNGISVDVDRFQAAADELRELAGQDIRAVELEAPSHGRRQEAGWFSGERFFAQSPVSTIEFFGGMAVEIATLIAWCRRHGSARVAVGGVSMGALASLSFAGRSRDWPSEQRADALLLITFADRMDEVVFHSGITCSIGLPGALEAAGWTARDFEALREYAEPPADSGMPTERVVAVLGARDTVLPYRLGRALAERWNLPAANLFTYDLGHFTVPVALVRDRAPVTRLRDILLGDDCGG